MDSPMNDYERVYQLFLSHEQMTCALEFEVLMRTTYEPPVYKQTYTGTAMQCAQVASNILVERRLIKSIEDERLIIRYNPVALRTEISHRDDIAGKNYDWRRPLLVIQPSTTQAGMYAAIPERVMVNGRIYALVG